MDIPFMTLSRLAFGYWEGQPLYAMAELGVFDALADGPSRATALADRLNTSVDGMTRLLDAGVALRLLTRDPQTDGRYRNSELAASLLTSTSPDTLIHWVRVMGRWSRPWSQLADAVRTGRTVEDQGLRLGDDPGYMRDFILGMHEYARRGAGELPRVIPLDGLRRAADIGGGAGTYAIALARAAPSLHVAVLDLKPVLDITRAMVAAHGLSDRISTGVIDYAHDRFGADLDLVLMSNVLHQESDSVCLSMLGRARDALTPGGRVVVQGHFVQPDRTGPLFATLHNLSALALWSGGHSRTLQEMADLAARAGFTDISHGPVGKSGLSMVTGLRA